MKLLRTNKLALASSLLLFVIGFFLVLNSGTKQASAAYDGSRLIDDSLFLNATTMSAQEIQAFLIARGGAIANATFVMNCSIAGTQANNAYIAAGAPCGQTVPASQVIFFTSQIYGVNPRVIIATMQKEQSLITATNPTARQYVQAMGYGCPTTGSCDDSSNFFWQVDNGTWVLRWHYERARGNFNWWRTSTSWTCGNRANDADYSFYRPGLNPGQAVTFYDGLGYRQSGTYTYVDGNGVTRTGGVAYRTYTLANAATAAFYCYTPHAYNNPQGLFGRAPYGTVGQYYSGSYNFVLFYELWFGSTIGSNYAWNIESFTYSGGDNNIPVGTTETLTLRARNIGVVPWYNHGANPVRLGTWEPADRQSSLFRTNRLTTVQESVVLPGEIGTFVFQVTPQTPGTFYESLNLVSENNAFAEWPGFRPTINVPRPYEWTIQNVIYEKGTGLMDPGESQLITVIAKNTGTATWSKSNGIPIRMGTWQPQRSSSVVKNWLSNTRAVEMNESVVAPGQNAGFQFYVRMPGTGAFYERLNLVAEGQAWFNDNGLTLYLFGNDYKWSVESVTYSNGTGVMPTGSSQVITLKARNTGTATWTRTGDFPINLGTWQPQRQSSVSQSWPSSTRMATLSENQVAPGQVGTFTSTVTVPSKGLFYERMNLVAEGLKWFNDPALTFYLEAR